MIGNADGGELHRVFRGPYSKLLAENLPVVGSLYEFGDFDFYVDDYELAPDGAGAQGVGTLTIKYTREDLVGRIELDWHTIERPVEANVYFSSLTDTQRALANAYLAESNPAKQQEIWSQMNGTAQNFAAYKLRGVEGFVVPTPTLRRTTRSIAEPVTGYVGARFLTLPYDMAPAGYQWLKMVDRATDRARGAMFERVEEWAGASQWDAYLYPTVYT